MPDNKAAPSFTQWFGGPRNPMHRASDTAKYFTADALKAAFEAGEARQKWLSRRRNVESEPDVFTI